MTVPLSERVSRHVVALFSAGERDPAERLLLDWSAASSDPAIPATSEGWERLRIAALRLSQGDLEGLRAAIDLAKRDWRDLLVAAGFADDVQAHERWTVRKVTPEILDQWTAGAEIRDVSFRRGDSVEVYGGEHPSGIRGVVISIVDFEPEPQYTVELASGLQIRVLQSWLWRAG